MPVAVTTQFKNRGVIIQILIGWVLIIFGGGLYFVQVISSINFPLAQRLGIQEKPESSGALLQRAERYTAYWDLFTLLWLPLAGIFMVVNHSWWPIIALIAGAIYFDSAGREFAKNQSFRHEGFKTGTAKQQLLFLASYFVMAIIAIVVIIYSILSLPGLYEI